MFEDDVTVPAGWYPDPMGLPQLRWWNNHAWTELTTEARPPLVMQQPTKLAYADDELPTRRQQREQREREEQYNHLATDTGEARDVVAAQAPLTVPQRELDPPKPETGETPVIEPLVIPALVEPALTEPAHAETIAAATTPKDGIPTHTESTPAVPHTVSYTQPVYTQPRQFDDRHFDDRAEFDAIFMPRSAASAAVSPDPLEGFRLPGEEPQIPRSGFEAGSFSDARSPDTSPRGIRTTTLRRQPIYTGAVWVIALVPVLQLLLSLLLLVGFGSSLGFETTGGIVLGLYILVVILAIVDRSILGRLGYDHRASWAWAFLSAPVYLIARSMSVSRIGGLGLAPMLVWASLGLLQVASILVVPGLLISAVPSAFSLEAEQSVASQASIIGSKLDVSCPENPPVLIGQEFTCDAKTDAGKDYRVTVSLQRVNGWIDWRVDDWGAYTLTR